MPVLVRCRDRTVQVWSSLVVMTTSLL